MDYHRCLQLAHSWIAECNDKHPLCGTCRVRALDLGPCDGPIEIKLHVTEAELASYVALSYCWGKVGNLKTTKATLEKRKTGIPWETLPKSFRDAVLIIRGLGIRYLWIDSLCIVQGDESDWAKESANMAPTYENAFLTIATDSSRDPTCGCLGPRDEQPLSSTRARKPERKRNMRVEELAISDTEGTSYPVRVRQALRHSEFVITQPHFDIMYPLLSRA